MCQRDTAWNEAVRSAGRKPEEGAYEDTLQGDRRGH